ncbi:MAG: hypothetical protein ACREPT_04730 [Rudaea sp.]
MAIFLGVSVLTEVQALHQAELIEVARAIADCEEFSITTRSAADESMALNGICILDAINVLRTCTKITMNFSRWPCAEYHGLTLDGEHLTVVAVISHNPEIVKIVKVWKP